MITELITLRNQIDKIDKELLRLLSRRMTLVAKVSRVKIKYNLPIYVPKREELILTSRRKEAEELGISPDLIEDILRRIMQESYSLAKKFNNTATA